MRLHPTSEEGPPPPTWAGTVPQELGLPPGHGGEEGAQPVLGTCPPCVSSWQGGHDTHRAVSSGPSSPEKGGHRALGSLDQAHGQSSSWHLDQLFIGTPHAQAPLP